MDLVEPDYEESHFDDLKQHLLRLQLMLQQLRRPLQLDWYCHVHFVAVADNLSWYGQTVVAGLNDGFAVEQVVVLMEGGAVVESSVENVDLYLRYFPFQVVVEKVDSVGLVGCWDWMVAVVEYFVTVVLRQLQLQPLVVVVRSLRCHVLYDVFLNTV